MCFLLVAKNAPFTCKQIQRLHRSVFRGRESGATFQIKMSRFLKRSSPVHFQGLKLRQIMEFYGKAFIVTEVYKCEWQQKVHDESLQTSPIFRLPFTCREATTKKVPAGKIDLQHLPVSENESPLINEASRRHGQLQYLFSSTCTCSINAKMKPYPCCIMSA